MATAALPLDLLPIRPNKNASTSYTMFCRDYFNSSHTLTQIVENIKKNKKNKQEKYNCSGSANESELGLTASHWLGAQSTRVCSTVSIFLKAQISPSTAIKSFRMNSDLWKAFLINHASKPTSSFPVRKHLLAFLRFWYLRNTDEVRVHYALVDRDM